jgi:uncharacterized protein YqeY
MSNTPFTSKDLNKMSLEKLPPHNLDAERAVLGAVFIDPQFAIPEVLKNMAPDDFYRSTHRKIFDACRALVQSEGPIDLILLKEFCEREQVLEEIGGPAYLAALCDVTPTAANVAYYAGIIREKALLRRLLNACITGAMEAYNDNGLSHQLIETTSEQIAAVYRQSFFGKPIFWTQTNSGIADQIEQDKYLRFLHDVRGFAMLQLNATVLFIKKEQNILQETIWVKSTNKTIKDDLKAYCREFDRNDVWKTLIEKNKLFTPACLTGLDTLENDFYRDTEHACTLFFQNGAVQVTASDITFAPYDQIEGYIWQDNINPHEYHGLHHLDLKRRLRADLIAAMKARKHRHVVGIYRLVLNAIRYLELEYGRELTDLHILSVIRDMVQERQANYDVFLRAGRIDLADRESMEEAILLEYDPGAVPSCEYQQFLEYVSREDIEEYDGTQHHVDNLHAYEYALAHLMHRYNNPVNMRAIVLADSNPSFVSNGRRGKKIILDALKHLKGPGVVVKEDGKAFDQKGRFTYQRIRPNTQILVIDDVSEEFDFKALYSCITDGMVVEGKGISRFAFTFEDNPKIAITTNHPCYDEDVSSTERSVLLPVSDYFIKNGITPFQKFGHRLYDDWSDIEWQRFFDYFISLIQKYLQRSDPSVVPTVDLTIFNANKLLLKVPEVMVNFLDGLVKGKDHEKDDIAKQIEDLGLNFRSAKEFTKFLHTYCRLRGYRLKVNTKDGRYILDGVEYINLIQVTPDLYDTKYAKKPTR